MASRTTRRLVEPFIDRPTRSDSEELPPDFAAKRGLAHWQLRHYAYQIERNWRNVSPHARPYLDAMHTLSHVLDSYYLDDGTDILARFLNAAQTWRGEAARRIKQDLNEILRKGQDIRFCH